jgi:hypothetical protein
MFQNSSGYSKPQCYFVRGLFHYVVTTSDYAAPVNDVLERISKCPRCDLENIPAFAWKDSRKQQNNSFVRSRCSEWGSNAVAYPGFFSGGVQQIQLRTEDRENGDLGTEAP